ncbi:MAG: SLBB domain-containing protein [Treponema sp.]|nr:SLBB domain-containing protein [Treponema sp.]
MRIYSFLHGGLSFDDPTAPQKGSSVLAFLPAISVVPMGYQGFGRVYPLVSPGDLVREGMLIGKASGPGSVNVHATVSGRILRKVSWTDSEGNNCQALVIRLEGAFEKLGKREELFPWTGMSSYDIQRIISDYGIVEMENRGQSLSEMISTYRRSNDRITLVVRCVFDDPWLAADYTLCRERIAELVEGSFITAHACVKVTRVLFAVSHKEAELGKQLLAEAGRYNIPSAVVLMGSRYPQRNGREMELALRAYEKKESMEMGAFLIMGPATMAAVYDAVKLKKPVLDRYVAVGGSAVSQPKVMKVRIGTRIGELFEQCGGFINVPALIAKGSPLSGRAVVSLDEPVDKTCFAVFAMLKADSRVHAERSCINCGECRAVCPLGLDPEELYKQIKTRSNKDAFESECHGCGCCKVVCPSALPLSELIQREKLGVKYA